MAQSPMRADSSSPFVGRNVEDAKNALVHAEHDGSAGDGPHEVRGQAAVETHEALFPPDEAETLDQARVLELTASQGCLSQPCPGDL